jgi:hypothetical protein
MISGSGGSRVLGPTSAGSPASFMSKKAAPQAYFDSLNLKDKKSSKDISIEKKQKKEVK